MLLGPQVRERLDAMPKSVRPKAKGHLHDIRQAGAEAEPAFGFSSRHMA